LRQLNVINHLTLDGVMQGPGRPEEDRRGGFGAGGWAAARVDDEVNEAVAARRPTAGGLVLGRRSYEGMLGFWNTTDSPFKDLLNAAPKHVASTTLHEPFSWPNTTLLGADVPAAVAALKQQPGEDLAIMGSGELIQALLPHGLIDELLLLVHPIVLGRGLRLFPDGGQPATFDLVDAQTSTTGVQLLTLRAG
jgi:dihydrofolate reductase